MTATLELSGLRKAFGPVQALADVALVVAAGELHGLVGANGAGKTTTLSCVAGTLRPDAGTICVCGVDACARRRETAPLIGVAGQRIALYGGLSVRVNVTFFARAGGAPRARAGRLADELVEALGLGNLAERRAMTLSVGQQRIVHVACALAHAPPLVLLDEPTAGLDAGARAALAQVLRARVAEGAAVVLSTHQLHEVEEQCATVTVLDRGQVLASGTVASLIEQFGAPRVELTIGTATRVHAGDDVAAALATLEPGAAVDAVRVVRSSFQAAFATLTCPCERTADARS